MSQLLIGLLRHPTVVTIRPTPYIKDILYINIQSTYSLYSGPVAALFITPALSISVVVVVHLTLAHCRKLSPYSFTKKHKGVYHIHTRYVSRKTQPNTTQHCLPGAAITPLRLANMPLSLYQHTSQVKRSPSLSFTQSSPLLPLPHPTLISGTMHLFVIRVGYFGAVRSHTAIEDNIVVSRNSRRRILVTVANFCSVDPGRSVGRTDGRSFQPSQKGVPVFWCRVNLRLTRRRVRGV